MVFFGRANWIRKWFLVKSLIFINVKPLYTKDTFNSYKSTDKLPLECYQCGEVFYKEKKSIKFELANNRGENKYCSRECYKKDKTLTFKTNCTHCGLEIYKAPHEIKNSKSGNIFCSKSCAGTYNNKHKTFGTRRSKLEIWLEEQLTQLYPELHIDYNGKEAIGSELDIYIPLLNLAIELNGIFHYEPIYGKNKLGKIQENDLNKSKVCHDNKIDLCIIDTSQQKYVKESTSKKYLDIIIKILDERLLTS